MASMVKAGYSLTDVEDTAKEDKLGATLAALTPSSFRHTQQTGAVESARFLLAHGAVAGYKAAAGYYRGRTAAQLAADGKKDMDGVIKRMIEQKMAGETGVASMLGTRRSSVIRSRALKAAVLGTIETAVEVNDQEMKKKSRACSIL